MIQLEMIAEHAKALIALLGQQPTHSGAFILYNDLLNQLESQLKLEAEAEDNAE